ncbi:threonine synthase [Paenibacillus rhizovicinus]|uniref:Threonine synthase n=1 Tax=Paenibacillus rhizovicinus TaxID=2704463 RepID=A0A6C0NUS9_9BACL|nr:threonine synthase [Paenibacillus rhizovicinus]QHW29964.1 threonine synthase [Paenibacillus rhizovicinus]
MKARCVECGAAASLAAKPMRYACHCGGLLEVVHDFGDADAERLKDLFHRRLGERHTIGASGVWRYKELIAPELPDAFIVTRNEGNTGIYGPECVREFAGIRQLWLKAQSENPSGSFKDNGMTAAVSHGASLGYASFACTSTGNTSSSLSMYAATAGVPSLVLVPDEGISLNKVLQTLAYGAQVAAFPGTYDDGIRWLNENGEKNGCYVCNSVNPMRIEGQKSIVFELAQDLNWELPDWIVLPGGALSNASALGKGLRELFALGFIARLPRVAVVQAEGAGPFHRMVDASLSTLIPEPAPRTVASALNIGNPPSWRKALETLKLTAGVTTAVSDAEIMAAKACVDRSGIGCEPASAAAVAGLRKLVQGGVIHRDETAACILTGSLLKDTNAINSYHLGADYSEAPWRNGIRRVKLNEEFQVNLEE